MSDAALARRFGFDDDPWIGFVLAQLRMRDQDAAQHVLDHVVRIVDDSIHNAGSCVLVLRGHSCLVWCA